MPPLLPQTDSEKFAKHVGGSYQRSTNIHDQFGAARRQSQVWRWTVPQGAQAVRGRALGYACGRWLELWQALRVAFVALQIVGPHR
jgi:hypothetical protein